jgi:hypothetical protein
MNNVNHSQNLAARPRAGYFLAVFLLAGLLAARASQAASPAATNTPAAIPWNQIGAKAGVDYQGDGLAVTRTEFGARLHCVFQRLDGEATREGLWLTSTVTNQANDRFRVEATAIGRVGARVSSPVAGDDSCKASNYSGAGGSADVAALKDGRAPDLAREGKVELAGQTVRFDLPGVTEEYSVSMDGVRQDFLVTEKPGRAALPRRNAQAEQQIGPATDEELRLELSVSGARVEPTTYGAQLVLGQSGRKIAYSRLRATDANGKELPARVEVGSSRCDDRPSLRSYDTASRTAQRAVPANQELSIVVNDTGAIYPVRIDPTFSDANWVSLGGVPGADGFVFAAVIDGSGNLYIGGLFNAAGNTIANNIAQWNGSSWSALGSGVSGGDGSPSVVALAVSGSTVYAGGYLTNAGGNAANSIAQWNGSSWSALGSGMSGGSYPAVTALAVSGGTLYAGGNFYTAGGVAATNIAQWNGSGWSALGSGMNSTVTALAVSGGTLYAGGYFSQAGGSAANYIARWNGSTWSALGSGVSGGAPYGPAVNALAVSGGTLYAGGYFTNAGGSAANNIARWNGSTWSALGSGIGGPYGPGVNALAVSGGTLLAGGYFSQAGGSAANNIAQWNGSSWSALGSGTGGDGTVLALAVSGTNLYAGGLFTQAGGNAANYIAQWNGSGWSALGSGMNYIVEALAVSGGTLYAGGQFTRAGGSAANCIAQWNGSGWSALGSGLSGGDESGPFVLALAVSGGTLYAGGDFTTAGGSPANNIAQWNGSNWSALGSGVSGVEYETSYVFALAVSGGTLFAGGAFTNAGGNAANYIAQWNGSSWSALGSGMGGEVPYVLALAVSGGTLYAGGDFTTAGSDTNANYIAQWNGSSWSALGSGMDSDVQALAVSGTNLYAGGYFTQAGGNAATNIAQWNGSSWSALGSGIDFIVYALAVSGGTLYAGGDFSTAGGSAANNIAQWNGSSWSPLGSGMVGQVSALAVSGSMLYAGGWFTTAGGKVSAYAAEAYLVAPPGGLVDSIVLPSPGTADLKCYGNPGQQFGVQRTTNLSPPLWTNVNSSPLIPAADGSFTITDTNAPPGAAFYRAFQY